MAIQDSLLFIFLILISSLAITNKFVIALTRHDFPEGFFFGTGSSAYQYEGGYRADGKGLDNWDLWSHKHPDMIFDHSTGDVAVDFYHRYKEDIKLMKDLGMDAFRLSILWSRVVPTGKISDGVNKKGIDFYNNVINELLANGIMPFVTIFHWDVPLALEKEYIGFLKPGIVEHYTDFAELCFKEFGDRVKHWVTLNEPWSYAFSGYVMGMFPPGRCSKFLSKKCAIGNSGTEPYIAAHNLLLSHSAAVQLYRNKYQGHQKGQIGITINVNFMLPYSNSTEDKDATQRALDFMYGWFMDPVTFGDYPDSMHERLGNRLPKFTKEQSELLKKSYDFLGLNYYTTYYAMNIPPTMKFNASYITDSGALTPASRNGVPIGPQGASYWLYVYPPGFYDLLTYTKEKYNNPKIIITENGYDEANNSTLPLEEQLNDTIRIDYYSKHLYYLNKAIKDGVNVKGYFAWALLDNYEWQNGYSVRFGIYYIDYKNGLKRIPKKSVDWFKKFLKRN